MGTTTTPTLLLAREVAEQFGVAVKTVGRWAGKGWLTAIKTPGGAYRYPQDEVVQLLQETSAQRRGSSLKPLRRCTVCGRPSATSECANCFVAGDDAFRRAVDR